MSAEAIARLREMLSGKDAEAFVDTGDLRFADLRALLDAHAALAAALENETTNRATAVRLLDRATERAAALEAAHTEALDALEAQEKYGCLCAMAEEGDPGVCGQCAMRAAVLAKAGRRE